MSTGDLNLDSLVDAVKVQAVDYEESIQALVKASDPSEGEDSKIRTRLNNGLDTHILDNEFKLGGADITDYFDYSSTNKVALDKAQDKLKALFDKLYIDGANVLTAPTTDSSYTDFKSSFVALATADNTEFAATLAGAGVLATNDKLTPGGLDDLKTNLKNLFANAKSYIDQTLDISQATVLTTEVQLAQGKSDLVTGVAKSASDFIKKLAQKMQ